MLHNKTKNYFTYISERKKGRMVKDGFEFTSNNSEILTSSELKKIIKKLNAT